MTKHIRVGRAWHLLYIPHNGKGSQETVEEFPNCPCTGIWVTDTGLEFTAQYDTGPYNPYAPDHNTTEMWPVSPVEPDYLDALATLEKKAAVILAAEIHEHRTHYRLVQEASVMNALSDWLLEHPYGQHGLLSDLEVYAELLGGEVDGDFILCPSPGRPANDRSCIVRINKDGQPYIYDVEDPPGAAYRFVRERLKLAPPRPSANNSAFARDILSETRPAAGTLVERYLRKRALTLPIPPCLHFHPSLRHSGNGGDWPAMVAERADVEGRVFAIHRTYLAYTGNGKAQVDPVRMDLGRASGTAIRLSPVADELMIGEGIETTLSAMQLFGLPGWAAGSAVTLRQLQLPESVKSVIVLVDNDSAGENASREAAQRWISEGRRVRATRSKVGNDFNDALIARAAS
jgi:hypothetical protein